MPTLVHFGAFRIEMYFADHNPAHVHVRGADFAAMVRISDSAIIAGDIPSAHRKRALDWITKNRATLKAKWRELQ